MNKDRVEGKAKDIAGRVERQVGEWTGDGEAQAHGTMKQVEGKVQNAWGKVKDAGKEAADEAKARRAVRQDEAAKPESEEEETPSHRRVS